MSRQSVLSKSIIENELGALSNTIGEAPKEVKWAPQEANGLTAVIVTWGQVRLEDLGGDDIDTLGNGGNPHVGMLVDFAGDLQASAKAFRPIFRISGGPGYVYAAGFEANGRGHRRYVAIDASQVAARQFEVSLAAILQEDRSLAADDYHLWPKVASETRKLALDTSPALANGILDEVFQQQGSTKLRSHVWSALPLRAIQRLGEDKFSRLDIYGPKTGYPQVRSDIETLIANEPSDPYIAFAYFVHGDIESALTANHAVLIADVLHYAAGYRILQSVLQDSLQVEKANPISQRRTNPASELGALIEDAPDKPFHVNDELQFFNYYPAFHENKALATILPGSAAKLSAAQSHFEEVVRHPSSAIADDAAYMSGWISLQLEKHDQALASYSQAMVIGNGDYAYAALKEVVRELQRRPPQQALGILKQSPVFSKEPALWYAVARSAYRNFDFQQAIEVAKQGLQAFNVPFERLPVTTDLDRILSALERIDPKLVNQINIREMPYLIEASREMLQYEGQLDKVGSQPPEAFERYSKAIIIKYSLLRDPPVDLKTGQPLAPMRTAHNDYRQAAHLIELSLQKIPRDPDYTKLREWLHFRYVRVLTLFAPERIPGAIAAMRQEFPNSPLINDTMAEQVYSDGIVMKDTGAAEKAFMDLLRQYPNGNAVDNAFSWMAITERCAGRDKLAEDLNKEIVHRFPMTRHAVAARARLADPKRFNDPISCGEGQLFYSY